MSTYIASNANRWYCQLESSYGQVPAVSAQNRIPAVKLTAKVTPLIPDRKDKSGSRTFAGQPWGGRQETSFTLKTYMTGSANAAVAPSYGPLIQAAMGAAALLYAGGVSSAASNSGGTLGFATPHGLQPNQAVTFNGEIRFVGAVIDTLTVLLNAPFGTTPTAGAAIGATVTYGLAAALPSVSVFDYWSPATALQRILCGGAINQLSVKLNSDYHEFDFQGVAQDLLDSASFASGSGQLSAFPVEPAFSGPLPSVIPGSLGQVWLGNAAAKFLTITDGTISLDNDIELRAKEFGSSLPRAVVPGNRKVLLDLDLYSRDDAATTELYQSARQRSPIGVALQLGQAAGSLMGIYLKSVIPEVPELEDSDRRLQWRLAARQESPAAAPLRCWPARCL
jgi:hypothetical protein